MTTDPAIPNSENPPCEVTLQWEQQVPNLDQEWFKQWVTRLLRKLAPAAESFCLRLTDDQELQRMNFRYRNKDRPTDVLSFPGQVSFDGAHLGDVAISVPTAKRQAELAGHSETRELMFLTLHGTLHCLGYDHETDDGTMDTMEARLREEWIGAQE